MGGSLRVDCYERIAMSDSNDPIGVEPGKKDTGDLLAPLGSG